MVVKRKGNKFTIYEPGRVISLFAAEIIDLVMTRMIFAEHAGYLREGVAVQCCKALAFLNENDKGQKPG
jgi:hypothetical protein